MKQRVRIVIEICILIASACLGWRSLLDFRDRYVFPGAYESRDESDPGSATDLPDGVINFPLLTKDRNKLDVWRLSQAQSEIGPKKIVIIFHGDSGTVEDAFGLQEWFQELGFISYSFDYRGFGLSTGWPTEKNVESDSLDLYSEVIRREKVDNSQIYLAGFSFGAGPAASLAAQVQPKLLLLVAPYTSLIDCDHEKFWFGPLMSYFWYDFPIKNFIPKLKSTDLILVHGTNDSEIPFEHSRDLAALYRGAGHMQLLIKPGATHRSVFSRAGSEIKKLIVKDER